MNQSKVAKNVAAMLLTVVLVNGLASAAIISGGAITVSSSDLQAGQSDPTSGNTNFNFRYSYGAGADGYYQNGNYTTADQTGWATAANWYTNAQRWNSGGSAYSLTAVTSSTVGAIQWTFDFAGTGEAIDKLVVRIPRIHYAAGTTSALYINVGSGGDQQYQALTSTTGWEINANYYDLTSYAKDLNHFTIRTVFWPAYWNTIQFMNASSGSDMGLSMDVQATLVPVPEPMSLALLGIGGMAALLPRRRSRKDVD